MKEQTANPSVQKKRTTATPPVTTARPVQRERSVQPAAQPGRNAQTIAQSDEQATGQQRERRTAETTTQHVIPAAPAPVQQGSRRAMERQPPYDTELDTLYTGVRLPTSVVRVPTARQNIATLPRQQPIVARTTRNVRADPITEPRQAVRPQKRHWHTLVYLGIALLFICIGISLNMFLPPLMQNWQDTMTYGYPRTSQTDANVGHGDAQHPKSHFIAWNEKGVIKVLEEQGGGVKTQLYIVTTYEGPGADLHPVTLSFAVTSNSHRLDMLVHCNGTTFLLFNNGTTFTAR